MISLTRLESVAKWVNIADLVVQCGGTVTYLFAIKSFSLALYDGAHALQDDALLGRLERALASTTWSWLNIVPYLLLLTCLIHKGLFALLARRRASRLDTAAFAFDSLCALATMSWLTYWLSISALVQVACFFQNQGLQLAMRWLNLWIVALASMTVSMAVCVSIDFLYLAKARAVKDELQDELSIPFLTEPVV